MLLIIAAITIAVLCLGGLTVAGALGGARAVRDAEAQIEVARAVRATEAEHGAAHADVLLAIQKLEAQRAANGQGRLTPAAYVAGLPAEAQEAAKRGEYTDGVLAELLAGRGKKGGGA